MKDHIDELYEISTQKFESNGYEITQGSNSKTDYGHSRYFYVNQDNEADVNSGLGFQVRVSDHSTGDRRILNAEQFIFNESDIEVVYNRINYWFNPEEYKNVVAVKNKVVQIEVGENDLQPSDSIISERVAKSGSTRYTIKRTYKNEGIVPTHVESGFKLPFKPNNPDIRFAEGGKTKRYMKKIKRGGITYGKSHAEGGIPVKNQSTGDMLEVEGGEGIVNKRSMASKSRVKLNGKDMSICEAVSQLNQMEGGVQFSCEDVSDRQFIKAMAKGGELDRGTRTEQEHIQVLKDLYAKRITPKQASERIAKDHLKEDSRYYSKLAKMEGKMAKGGKTKIESPLEFYDWVKFSNGDVFQVRGIEKDEITLVSNSSDGGNVKFSDIEKMLKSGQLKVLKVNFEPSNDDIEFAKKIGFTNVEKGKTWNFRYEINDLAHWGSISKNENTNSIILSRNHQYYTSSGINSAGFKRNFESYFSALKFTNEINEKKGLKMEGKMADGGKIIFTTEKIKGLEYEEHFTKSQFSQLDKILKSLKLKKIVVKRDDGGYSKIYQVHWVKDATDLYSIINFKYPYDVDIKQSVANQIMSEVTPKFGAIEGKEFTKANEYKSFQIALKYWVQKELDLSEEWVTSGKNSVAIQPFDSYMKVPKSGDTTAGKYNTEIEIMPYKKGIIKLADGGKTRKNAKTTLKEAVGFDIDSIDISKL